MFFPTLSLGKCYVLILWFPEKTCNENFKESFFIVAFKSCFVKVGPSTPSSSYAGHAGNETQTPGRHFGFCCFLEILFCDFKLKPCYL